MRGIQFSRKGDLQRFRDLIFADGLAPPGANLQKKQQAIIISVVLAKEKHKRCVCPRLRSIVDIVYIREARGSIDALKNFISRI